MRAPHMFKDCWDVLSLFLIPVGGGIPAGVILARDRGLAWPVMSALYFLSDLILACLFEPLLYVFMWAAKRSPFLSRLTENYRVAMAKVLANYKVTAGPFSLIMLSFGVDPMTGRSAARAAGHGFISGWALAIAGDMIYFTVIMICTLWLNSVLGDGTWTTTIILAAMLIVPALVRRLRSPRS